MGTPAKLCFALMGILVLVQGSSAFAASPVVQGASITCLPGGGVKVSGVATDTDNDMDNMLLIKREFPTETDCQAGTNEILPSSGHTVLYSPTVGTAVEDHVFTCEAGRWYKAEVRAGDNTSFDALVGSTCCQCVAAEEGPLLSTTGLIVLGVVILGIGLVALRGSQQA